jgi:hypothetical protein
MSDIKLRQVTLGGRRHKLAGHAGDSFLRYAGQHRRGMEELAAVAAAAMPTPGVVVDVGANLGLSALVLAPLASRLLLVEAAPRTAQALRRTLAANALVAELAEVALGAAPGSLAFHQAAHSAGSHLLSEATLGAAALERVTVPVTTLDALVAEYALPRVDFIKIDVEGHETEVLDGARATLARWQPVVMLEFNAWVLQCNRAANPRLVLEDWLSRFPVAHALRGKAPPLRLGPESLLGFLHDHLVLRGCADELVLSQDDAWVGRFTR